METGTRLKKAIEVSGRSWDEMIQFLQYLYPNISYGTAVELLYKLENIYKIEDIKVREVVAFAKFLNVSSDYLLGISDSMHYVG